MGQSISERARAVMDACCAVAQDATFAGFDDSVLKEVFAGPHRRLFETIYRMGFESGWRVREQQIAAGAEPPQQQVSTARVSRPEEAGPSAGATPASVSPAAGILTLGDLIAKVGGRINDAGYVEFGSEMAVLALVRSAISATHPNALPA